jgi:hypothetical protein
MKRVIPFLRSSLDDFPCDNSPQGIRLLTLLQSSAEVFLHTHTHALRLCSYEFSE